jgi:hypothetical protein
MGGGINYKRLPKKFPKRTGMEGTPRKLSFWMKIYLLIAAI